MLSPTVAPTTASTSHGAYALQFDGTSHVKLPQLQSQPSNIFCLEAIVTPRRSDSADLRGIIAWPSLVPSYGILIANGNEKGAWKAKIGATAPAQTAQGTVKWEEPIHVAASSDGTTLTLFLNGIPVKTSEAPRQVHFAKDDLGLGGNFVGDIRHVRISTSARYAGKFVPASRFEPDADTLALYRFDEGAGDVLQDSSGNNHHGKIVDAKWVRIDAAPILLTHGGSTGAKIDAPPAAVAPFDAAQARAHQEAWARYLGVPVEYENTIGMKFMLIPPGEFLMGSSDEQIEEILKTSLNLASPETEKKGVEDERPRHLVKITKPSYFGKTEVTNGDFGRFVDATQFKTEAERDGGGKLYDPVTRLSKTDPATNWRNPGYPFDSTLPVTQVTFNDGMAFCNWLSEKEKLVPAYSLNAQQRSTVDSHNGYHLPTEAQWEHACRAGTTTIWYTGDQPAAIAAHRTSGPLQPVGLKLPNPFGLRDLYGSVHELCDDHSLEPFTSTLQIDPHGRRVESRAVRGGHSMNSAVHCRSAHRHAIGVSSRDRTVGFRIVRELSLPGTSNRGAIPEVKPGTPATEDAKHVPPPAVAPFDAAKAREHQEAWSKYLDVPVELNDSFGIRFVLIPPGEFIMGSSEEDATKLANEEKQVTYSELILSEAPQHSVRIPAPFYLGVNEITVGQLGRVIAATGFKTHAETSEEGGAGVFEGLETRKPEFNWKFAGYPLTEDHPAGNLTHDDATALCELIGRKEKAAYRLPSEAEWEYACRAGTTGAYSFGDDVAKYATYAWPHSKGRTFPVGEKLPNSFGLFDMHGNVAEWCRDWHDNEFYREPAPIDVRGPSAGTTRVLRSQVGSAKTRSAARGRDIPNRPRALWGLRAVREIALTPQQKNAIRLALDELGETNASIDDR